MRSADNQLVLVCNDCGRSVVVDEGMRKSLRSALLLAAAPVLRPAVATG